jgi:N-formylglutamate amidohydrolase
VKIAETFHLRPDLLLAMDTAGRNWQGDASQTWATSGMLLRERQSILGELTPPFYVHMPDVLSTPYIFCSPHSGAVYPRAFLEASRLDAHNLRKSEDVLVDQLFTGAAGLGAPLIAARFPRAYLDVNREPFELDPELFPQPLPAFANTQSMRVAGGLGTIARIVADAEEIYAPSGRPTLEVALQRIELLYKPFHAKLTEIISATRQQFGVAMLIDCHSMPSSSMTRPGTGNRPDIVLGDRFGASCDTRLMRLVRDTISDLGLNVQLNRPYAGGFITENYGRPYEGVHALQIEINRSLYLDEATLQPNANFTALQTAMTVLTARMVRDAPNLLPTRHAAE